MDIRADHRPIAERLAERSVPEPNTGCLLWYGCRSKDGYGKLGVDGGEVYAHRLAYELVYGPIPDGLLVCHRCDTPNCINPDHLFVGTNAENLADRDAKGRADTHGLVRPGVDHPNAKLTDDAVRFIRANCNRRGDQRRMARCFGITEANVSLIIKRKAWPHVV